MNLHELKAKQQEQVNQLITDCKVFFAFSNEQFAANKTPLQEGEKYVSIGMGGYLPKSQVDNYINGLEKIGKEYRAGLKLNNLRKKNIAYELNNHEAYYTGSIDETLEALGEGYTAKEVQDVYNKERRKLILADKF